MEDWLDLAKDILEKEAAQQRKEEEKRSARMEEIQNEKSWIDQIQKLVDEIIQKGIRIQSAQTDKGLRLTGRGGSRN